MCANGGCAPAAPIRPRFGFDATASSCVCIRHHHHAYWRLDFDITSPGNNDVDEFNDPRLVPGSGWHRKSYEITRLRDPSRKRRWRVTHSPSGRAYEIAPGTNDGTAAGDAYAKGDVWFLRYKPSEIDAPIIGTEIQIDKYRTPPESIVMTSSCGTAATSPTAARTAREPCGGPGAAPGELVGDGRPQPAWRISVVTLESRS
jgi:hypothetical protein